MSLTAVMCWPIYPQTRNCKQFSILVKNKIHGKTTYKYHVLP